MKLENLDALRLDIGLVRNTHQTLEQIAEKIQPVIYGQVDRENIDSGYMPLNWPLD